MRNIMILLGKNETTTYCIFPSTLCVSNKHHSSTWSLSFSKPYDDCRLGLQYERGPQGVTLESN